MNLFALFEKAINEHGSATILRQHLLLIKEMLGKAEKECADLKNKVRQLEADKMQLSKELAKISTSKDFQEYRGVLFKKDPLGGYFEDVYCANCKITMSSLEPFLPFLCGKCGIQSGFKGHEITSILGEFLKRYP